MKIRFNPGRCCCGPAATVRIAARGVVHGAGYPVIRAGTVAVYRPGGASLGLYDFADSPATGANAGVVFVDLPTVSVANARFVINFPRCDEFDTGEAMTLNTVTPISTIRIASVAKVVNAKTVEVQPSSGYAAAPWMVYPQVDQLTLTDSVFGDIDLTWSDDDASWGANRDVDLYRADGLGGFVLVPGEIRYRAQPQSGGGLNPPIIRITAFTYYKSDGARSALRALNTGPATYWTADGGGGVSASGTSTFGHPWAPTRTGSVSVTLSVAE